ncbi:MAG: Crp/Fnr family transcriptional regulator [Deltaproteobacteria bacterium]|nr:Crp/Fnr family transcriptional regulator [Deltaproteobacteria bacterium]
MRVSQVYICPHLADALIGHHTLVNYNRGAMVVVQGSPADVVFYVISGLVKVYCPRLDGTRVLIKLAGPGDLVGYADYLDVRGHRAQIFEAQSLTKSSAALLTREHISNILSKLEGPILLQVIERLNTVWSSMAQWFATFLGMSFKERLELVLRELTTKFGVHDSRGVLLTPELAHSDFADMIGSSRPMVTRLMAEMIKQGLLLRQGKRLILCDPAAHHTASIRDREKSVAAAGPPGTNGVIHDSRSASPRKSSPARSARPLSLGLAASANAKRIAH